MLYIILASEKRFPFVSAVFDSEGAALAYLHSIQAQQRPQYSIHAEDLAFPLYITQDHRGFRFMTEDAVVRELDQFNGQGRRDDDDFCYTNLYRVASVFVPRVPGDDQMGRLPHRHVTNFTLDEIATYGFDALWVTN